MPKSRKFSSKTRGKKSNRKSKKNKNGKKNQKRIHQRSKAHTHSNGRNGTGNSGKNKNQKNYLSTKSKRSNQKDTSLFVPKKSHTSGERIPAQEIRVLNYFSDQRRILDTIGAFYSTLTLDYTPISRLSFDSRMKFVKCVLAGGISFLAEDKLEKAMEMCQMAITVLDCSFTDRVHDAQMNKQANGGCMSAKFELETRALQAAENIFASELLCTLAEAKLLYARTLQKSEDRQPISVLTIVSALNCCQVSCMLDLQCGEKSNTTRIYLQISYLFRLGFVDRATAMLEQCRSALRHEPKKLRDLVALSMQKSVLRMNRNVIQLKKRLLKIGCNASPLEILERVEHRCDRFQYLLLAVVQLYMEGQWNMSVFLRWLKSMFAVMRRRDNFHKPEMYLPSMLNPECDEFGDISYKDVEQAFIGYSLSFIAIAMDSEAGVVADMFLECVTLSDCKWKFCEQLSFLRTYANSVAERYYGMYCTDRVWKPIATAILGKSKFNADDSSFRSMFKLIRRHCLPSWQLREADCRHITWRGFYKKAQQQLSQTEKGLPANGRLKPVNYENGYECIDLAVEDLLNMHALATARKACCALSEMRERVMPRNVAYDSGFTWLHEFARAGCKFLCKFVVDLGMDINILDRNNDGQQAIFLYPEPVTPLDFSLKHCEYVLGLPASATGDELSLYQTMQLKTIRRISHSLHAQQFWESQFDHFQTPHGLKMFLETAFGSKEFKIREVISALPLRCDCCVQKELLENPQSSHNHY
jgi:hypothetical protein